MNKVLLFLKDACKIRYWSIYILFIFFFIVSFGKGTGAHYSYAPFLVLFSIIIIFNNYIVGSSYLIKPLLVMLFCALISSWHYLYFISPNYNYIEYISYSILPFLVSLVFYKFIHIGSKTGQVVIAMFMLFFCVGIYRYFRSEMMSKMMAFTQHQNNAFYQVLMPLPILFLSKHKLLKLIFLLMAILICVLSIKRSAIISIGVIALLYLYFNINFKQNGIKTMVLVLAFVSAFFSFMDTSEIVKRFDMLLLRMAEISSDGGSGRTDILSRFFREDIHDIFVPQNFLFGCGFEGVHNKYHNLAALHNDWAEVFYNYGMVGLISLAIFMWRLFKVTCESAKIKSDNAFAYSSASFIFLLYSLVGGNFVFINTSLPLFAFIGISEALRNQNKI
ncbi:O-antigen ligase family protein [Phocaeicola faecalis]|uniref:O-antigen ligase family protein n=1 Tax=Phocaeicola faecalis TaxID=2786956 RepID=UPI001F370192|nr:O-antigen ligase family protein [Phocaeicola faecalis]